MENIRISGKTIEEEKLNFASKGIFFLGPDLILKNCELTVKVTGRNFIIAGADFHNCTFIFKKSIHNYRWSHAKLYDCKFIGTLIGNDLGKGLFIDFSPETSAPYVPELKGGDFSECILDGCRFLDTDMTDIILPQWPCFTIYEPEKHKAALDELKGISESRFANGVESDYYRNDISALSYSASGFLNKYHTIDQELLHQELSALDFVVM